MEEWGSSAISVQGLDSDDAEDLEDEAAPLWRFGVDKCVHAPPVPAAPALQAVDSDTPDSNLEPDSLHLSAPPVEGSHESAETQPSDCQVDNVSASNRFDSRCLSRVLNQLGLTNHLCWERSPWVL